jgi:hypothetical protein
MILVERKIIYEIGDENLALKALEQAQEEIKIRNGLKLVSKHCNNFR